MKFHEILYEKFHKKFPWDFSWNFMKFHGNFSRIHGKIFARDLITPTASQPNPTKKTHLSSVTYNAATAAAAAT
jgi:hypothetical protein